MAIYFSFYGVMHDMVRTVDCNLLGLHMCVYVHRLTKPNLTSKQPILYFFFYLKKKEEKKKTSFSCPLTEYKQENSDPSFSLIFFRFNFFFLFLNIFLSLRV